VLAIYEKRAERLTIERIVGREKMYFSKLILSLIAFALCPSPSLADGSTYFVVNQPTTGTQWANGATNPVLWTKGLLDGVNVFDVELARLSTDGLIKVALNVPANSGKLNLALQDVPAGDDYYLLFLTSEDGQMFGLSSRFTILADGTAAPSNASSPVASAPTVTISGGPNPTASFATTFPASGALIVRSLGMERALLGGVLSAVVAGVLGAAWTVL